MSDVSIGDLRISSLRKSDQHDYGFVSGDELDVYIQEGISELHDIVLTADPKRVRKITTISLVNAQEEYDLPTDFCKLLEIWFFSGSTRYEMDELNMREVPEWQVDQLVPISAGGEYYSYLLAGDKLFLSPEPTGTSGSLEMWYAPQAPKVEGNASQKIGYQFLVGYDEYISNHAAACVLRKEQNDYRPFMERNMQLAARFEKTLKKRNKARPGHVTDVYGQYRRGRYRRRGL